MRGIIVSITILAILSISNVSFAFFTEKERPVLKIGVMPEPSGKILDFVKANFEKNEEFKIEIIEYSDCFQPNMDLLDGKIDGNYSQNEEFLKVYTFRNKADLISFDGVHFEKMGIYSKKYKSIKALKNVVVAIPNIETERVRALRLLEETGLIKLGPGNRILENPRNLKVLEVNPKYLVRVMEETGAVIVTGNYVLEKGIIPYREAIFLENYNEKYINILVGESHSRKKRYLQRLSELLKSPETKNFIKKEYGESIAVVE